MARQSRFTPEIREEIKRRRAAGEGYKQLARAFDAAPPTIYYLLHPEKDEKRKRSRNSGEAARIYRTTSGVGRTQSTRAERESILPPIPPDTRSLSARMFGDPLPGRSALDAKRRTLDAHYPPSGPLYIGTSPAFQDEARGLE